MTPVLDASALLAYLHREPGWQQVREAVDEGCVSAVNWCEVAQKAARRGLDVEQVRTLLAHVGLSIEPFTPRQAEVAALLWADTRTHGLSLADWACLALAQERQTRVLTANRVWSRLVLGLDIQVIW